MNLKINFSSKRASHIRNLFFWERPKYCRRCGCTYYWCSIRY
eukprot:UN10920